MDPDASPSAIFGAKLRKARKRAGLTQAEVAQRIQSTQAYISRAEKGLENPPLLTCVLLALAVDCEPRVCEAIDDLFQGDWRSVGAMDDVYFWLGAEADREKYVIQPLTNF